MEFNGYKWMFIPPKYDQPKVFTNDLARLNGGAQGDFAAWNLLLLQDVQDIHGHLAWLTQGASRGVARNETTRYNRYKPLV